MTDRQWEPTDEELLDKLRRSFVEDTPTPDNMVDMIMTGYDITNIDAHVAELTEDTAVDEPVGVRSAALGARLMTFEHGDLAIEFEIGPEAPQIVGHLEPPRPGRIRFEQPPQSETVELDGMARYQFTLATTTPFRLLYLPPAGTPIATAWILP